MPRPSRKPLTNRDVNVDTISNPSFNAKPTAKPNVSENEDMKDTKESLDSISKLNTGANADNISEVERLRAEVASLTERLNSATLGGAKNSKADENKMTANPFGGVMPSISGLMPPTTAAGQKPKRPLTAYQLYAAEHREDLRASNPSIDIHEISSRLAEMWKAASEKERAEYEERTAEDRERYSREMVAYEAKCDAIKEERCALEHMEQKMVMEKAMELYHAHTAEQREKGKLGMNNPEAGEVLKKPKKARSAYIFFSMKRHEEFAGTSRPDDAMARIGEEWKALQASKKKKDRTTVDKYNKMALEDQDRFSKEMEAYDAAVAARDAALAEQQNDMRTRALEMYRAEQKDRENLDALRRMQAEKKEQEKAEKAAVRAAKKAQKALKAQQPKRARPAYTFFFAEKSRDSAIRAQAEAEQTSPAAVIAALWKNCTAEEKEHYQALAVEDRERYQRETAAATPGK